MSGSKLRVIVLTQGGSEVAINRLLNLDCVEVAGIFVETNTVRYRSLRERISRSIRYDGFVQTILKLTRKVSGKRGSHTGRIATFAESRDRLREIAKKHQAPFYVLDDYHSQQSIALMRAAESDLGILLGTNILRESVFQIPRLGSINLHQGLAPYYRGGPSVFWELCNGEGQVGLTVHYVAPKVDTGDIVLQRTIPLEYDYSYRLNYQAFIDDYCEELKLPCATLLADAVSMIADGTAVRIPQEPNLGKRYRLPTKAQKDELRRRLRERRKQRNYAVGQEIRIGD
jgi:folate-dependent phosphoribosylglycinamide formyltransferase PurN